MNAEKNYSGGWRKALRRPFEVFDYCLDLVERAVLVVAILAMAAVSMVNVITRNLGASISWADEVAQLLVVVVTFVGLGHGVRMARHIRVSAIHDLLSERLQKILIIFISLTTAVLLLFLGIFATEYVGKLMQSRRVVPSLGIPVYYVYLIAPIGLFVGSAQYFLAFVRNLVSPGVWLSWHHKDEYEEELDEDIVGVNDTDQLSSLAADKQKPGKGEASNG